MKEKRGILIVAGETSGDTHAAKLVRAMRDAAPHDEFAFFGAAGPRMREVGVDAVVESDHLSVVGLPEIGRALPMFLRAMRAIKRSVADRKPAAAILVDFPDFNLKLAKWLKQHGLTVIYYISPQLWAWRKYRISTIKRYVDLVISILPFEKDWYLRHGVEHVEYVGSPLAREVVPRRSREEFCRDHGLDPSKQIVSLLPGSRHKELLRILPVMIDAARSMRRERPELQFLVALASDAPLGFVNEMIEAAWIDANSRCVRVTTHETYDALNASDAAAITSGTATLEAGIIGTPMVVVYKTSALNYRLLEPMIDVPHYGLINLIAEERVATELIQEDLTRENLSRELTILLNTVENAEMRKKLKAVAGKLGHGGASKRAAEAIIRHLSF